MNLIIHYLNAYLTQKSERQLRCLEFGCGNGYQIPFLEKLGTVMAMDIEHGDHMIKACKKIFCVGDICSAPYKDGQFDLIFSNHVLEHIPELEAAFAEMRRIGTPSCVYAFSVPTSIWLVLSVVVQYYNKAQGVKKNVTRRLFNRFTEGDPQRCSADVGPEITSVNLLKKILPEGHGVYTDFISCFSKFKLSRWRQLFDKNGFKIVETHPLLLYSPSEFPFLPPTRRGTKNGICSSILFILET